jgi:hypothetical protein
MLSLTIDTAASDDLAFRVGPVTDGIILTHSLSPIPLIPNYYEPLTFLQGNHPTIYQCMNAIVEPVSDPPTTETTPLRQIRHPRTSPFQPLIIPGTPDTPRNTPYTQRHTWHETYNEELTRIFHHDAASMVSNSQRLAHPYKVQRKASNRKRRHNYKRKLNAIWSISTTRLRPNPLATVIATHTTTRMISPIQVRSLSDRILLNGLKWESYMHNHVQKASDEKFAMLTILTW